MLFFSTPKDYSEMLNKIAFFAFWGFLISLIILANNSVDIKNFLIKLSLGYKIDKDGFCISISYVFIALFLAIVERALKLHNIISDIFRIRAKFDYENILIPMAIKSGISLNSSRRKHIKQKRYELMRNVFYLYASSTEPKIDRHYINMALDNWCWYWILLEIRLMFIILCFVLLFLNANKSYTLGLIIIVVLMTIISLKVSSSAKKCAKQEIDEILSDATRKSKVKGVFRNAL